MSVRSLSIALGTVLAVSFGSASRGSAAPGAEILSVTTNVLDCSMDMVFRVQDAGTYFVSMWDDGTRRTGTSGFFPAGAVGRVRYTIGGLVSDVAPGVGIYVEDTADSSGTTYDSSTVAGWSDALGNACVTGGEVYSVAIVSEECPTGTKLVLKDGNARALSLLAKDPRVTIGRGTGTEDDPIANAGMLRVLSSGGALFDDTYALPASGWSLASAADPAKGYRFRGTGAIRSVIVAPGKQIKIRGNAAALGHDLTSDPGVVTVELRLGTRRYCMRFGGETKFVAGKSFTAVSALADEFACPAS